MKMKIFNWLKMLKDLPLFSCWSTRRWSTDEVGECKNCCVNVLTTSKWTGSDRILKVSENEPLPNHLFYINIRHVIVTSAGYDVAVTDVDRYCSIAQFAVVSYC